MCEQDEQYNGSDGNENDYQTRAICTDSFNSLVYCRILVKDVDKFQHYNVKNYVRVTACYFMPAQVSASNDNAASLSPFNS